MNKKMIILIVSISIIICGVSLYTGFIHEAILFGYNVFTSMIKPDESKNFLDNNSTIINKSAYAYRLLTNINIPDNITTIENSAFKANKLTSVVIPSNVSSIGGKAFNKNRITSITIGSNVSIEENAFGFGFEETYKKNGMDAGTYMRNDTKSIEWSIWYRNFKYIKNNRNISIIGYNGFDEEIIIPEEINGYPVIVIGKDAFHENKFTSVVIPDSVKIIENMAFFGSWDNVNEIPLGMISNLVIGKNVTTIGDRVFENNLLSRIIIPDSVTSIGINAFADNPVMSISIGANVKLGDNNTNGILGKSTGFNTAYANNNNRAGNYTRPNTKSTTWTRTSQVISAQKEKIINSVNWKWSDNQIKLGTHGWSVGVQQFNEPIKNCMRFKLDYEFTKINYGNPYGVQDVYVKGINGSWNKVGSFNAPNNKKVTIMIRMNNPSDIYGVGIVPAKSISGQVSYENKFTVREFLVY